MPEQIIDPRPFVAPCRDLDSGAPLRWLKSGWQDYQAAPGLSLAWGGFCRLLCTALGIVTGLLGFILIIPLPGYATWLGYRDALDVSDSPVVPGAE